MSENTMPSLTLTPEENETAAAVAEAPTLSLDPNGEAAEAEKKKVEPVVVDDSMLTEDEKKQVDEFSKKIDITDSNQVLQYGSAAQKSVSSFSESALGKVRTKDLGAVGEDLTELVVELRGFGEEEKKGFAGLFKKQRNKLEVMKAQYSKAETNVEKIVQNLENHQITLMKDIAMFDQMYELNLKYYKELTMYIVAGKKRLAAVQANEVALLRQQAEADIAMFDQMYELNLKYYKELTMYIVAGKKRLAAVQANEVALLRQQAEASGKAEDAQAFNDMVQMCERFEKKLHDLELTRVISVQMGPQIRLLQNNDTLMVEKIQSSLVNTIPLWKSQMVLALGLEHSRQATAAQSAVTETTNELLKKNADMLKMGTIATAREAERSVVDIETLQHTNEQLISTLDEVLNIQREGAAKRKAAEAELGRIEGELKQKLMELHK